MAIDHKARRVAFSLRRVRRRGPFSFRTAASADNSTLIWTKADSTIAVSAGLNSRVLFRAFCSLRAYQLASSIELSSHHSLSARSTTCSSNAYRRSTTDLLRSRERLQKIFASGLMLSSGNNDTLHRESAARPGWPRLLNGLRGAIGHWAYQLCRQTTRSLCGRYGFASNAPFGLLKK